MTKGFPKKKARGKASEDLYTSSEVKRHMNVLMEHVDDRIAGIAERFVDFDRKLDSHAEMIGGLAEDVAMLTGNVATLTGNVAVLTNDVATLTEDVSIIKEKVSSIEDNLKRKVDREEFMALEGRVAVIEAKV